MNIKLDILRVVQYSVGFCLALSVIISNPVSAQEETEAVPEEAPPAPPMAATPVVEPEATVVAPEAPPAEPAPAETAAEPAPAESTPAAVEEEKKSAGVNVDVGLATIYNFRGANVFKESKMMDQNALFAPSVTWSIFDTGLSLGYWGAFQLSGDNKRFNVDYGLGHEQDLILGYSKGFADDLVSLDLAFTYYFYPFAQEDIAGCANPSIIEPMVGVSIATAVDIGFHVSYFHAIQKEIDLLRHAYFNFSLGKSFTFNDIFGMDLGMGLGIKAWIKNSDGEKLPDNRVDLHFDWSVPIHLTEQLYVAPALHFSWTDLKYVSVASGVDDDPGTADVDESMMDIPARAGDEYMIYASLNVGADF